MYPSDFIASVRFVALTILRRSAILIFRAVAFGANSWLPWALVANRLLSFSFYAFLNRICNFIEAYKHKHIVKWFIEYKCGTSSFIKSAKISKNAEKDPKSYDFRSK